MTVFAGAIRVRREESGVTDYSKMTNPQLAALCRERGIEVGARPKKAELIALLEGGD